MTALRPSTSSDGGGLAVVLAANLLPVAGVLVLGWRAAEVLVVYWIELVVMVAAYSVAALFAERPIDLEDREFYIVGFSENSEIDPDRWSGDPEPVGVVDRVLPSAVAERVPPIYRRNVPVVARSLGIAGFLAFGALVLADTVVTDPVAAASSPAVLAASLAVCVSQAAEIRREFFVTPRYEQWSPYMVLEAAQRVVTYYLCIGMVAVPVSFLGLVLVAGAVDALPVDPAALGPLAPATDVDPFALAYVVPFALAKAAADRSRRIAFDEVDPGGLAGWFAPEDPRPAWLREQEREW
ncbi:hypothetical protein SAMN04488066_10958 [Halorubrum aquaticum]|uniref:Uncharacterized protein n=1 Tax=Halorubrum aquaticum TaxID=387340 RepID=A0A1I3B4A5_9EURY|nr:DUF6498-containing protein [Halorubrum aquaticum]SFH56936.1 hypothetical protein SAMN04488066_10958 [Halorubrum aquaticum]